MYKKCSKLVNQCAEASNLIQEPDNKCLTPKFVYQADVCNDTYDERKLYLGLLETPFRERCRNEKREFTHMKHQIITELSKYI